MSYHCVPDIGPLGDKENVIPPTLMKESKTSTSSEVFQPPRQYPVLKNHRYLQQQQQQQQQEMRSNHPNLEYHHQTLKREPLKQHSNSFCNQQYVNNDDGIKNIEERKAASVGITKQQGKSAVNIIASVLTKPFASLSNAFRSTASVLAPSSQQRDRSLSFPNVSNTCQTNESQQPAWKQWNGLQMVKDITHPVHERVIQKKEEQKLQIIPLTETNTKIFKSVDNTLTASAIFNDCSSSGTTTTTTTTNTTNTNTNTTNTCTTTTTDNVSSNVAHHENHAASDFESKTSTLNQWNRYATSSDDPRYIPYVNEIADYLKSIENKHVAEASYMDRQTDVKQSMRTVLIDWLVDVHAKFRLETETLYLTVNIIDRYLSAKQVSKKNLQLIGVASFFLATKYEEIMCPSVKDLVEISANTFSRDELLAMETNILNTLEFNLTVATVYSFLQRYLHVAKVKLRQQFMALYVCELSLLEYEMLQFSPSLIAASAVCITNILMKDDHCSTGLSLPKAWSQELEEDTNYSLAEMKPCITVLVRLLKRDCIKDNNRSRFKAVKNKYSRQSKLEVASLVPSLFSKLCLELQAM